MTGKTIRVKENTHSIFFSLLNEHNIKSSDIFLKMMLVDFYEKQQNNNNLNHIYKGMYQIEEKS